MIIKATVVDRNPEHVRVRVGSTELVGEVIKTNGFLTFGTEAWDRAVADKLKSAGIRVTDETATAHP